MAQTINWLFIVLGIVIGAPVGFYGEKARVWQHRTRAGMRLAWPAIKLAGMAAGGIVLASVLGLVWLGVI